jgi:hypothetical protein
VIGENALDESGNYLNYVRNPDNGYRTIPPGCPGSFATRQRGTVAGFVVAQDSSFGADLPRCPTSSRWRCRD